MQRGEKRRAGGGDPPFIAPAAVWQVFAVTFFFLWNFTVNSKTFFFPNDDRENQHTMGGICPLGN